MGPITHPAIAGEINITEVWSATLTELEGQMVKATFNNWLQGTRPLRMRDGRLVVEARNEQAQDWLSNRLTDVVARTLSGVAGRELGVEFVVSGDHRTLIEKPADNPPISSNGSSGNNEGDAPGLEPPVFKGFPPITSNYTQAPNVFFDEVLPAAHGTISKLVGVVIRQTVGTFEDRRRNRRREEWAVNHQTVMAMAGISSKTSLLTALWDARRDGYIVLREIDPISEEGEALKQKMGYIVNYTLRIRHDDEEADLPTEARPEYGNRRQDKRVTVQ